jgi:hypothetical protein
VNWGGILRRFGSMRAVRQDRAERTELTFVASGSGDSEDVCRRH